MFPTQFCQAKMILNQLLENGQLAYIVGGSVRDFLLGRKIGDIDITTSASPEVIQYLFARTIPVGIEHGTVVVLYENHTYEVTTFREESDYHDHRRPSSVSFVSSLSADLARRDFTINAMAMSIDGDIIDPYGGRSDIEARVIRTVGEPEDRFREDPLRMMRAVRFAGQMPFTIESHTCQALLQMRGDLRYISVERIRDEFEKMLAGTYANHAITTLLDTGIYQYLPGFAEKKAGLLQLTQIQFSQLNKMSERWALVCYLLDELQPGSWLRHWKLPKKTIAHIEKIVETLDLMAEGTFTQYDLYQFGLSVASSAAQIRTLFTTSPGEVRLCRLENTYNNLPIKQRSELNVSGDDLIAWFQRRPGPWVSQYLRDIEEAVIAGVVENRKEAIHQWLN